MAKDETLDISVLLAAIKDFVDDYGRGGHAQILKLSGVHNTKRMLEGNIIPSLDTWVKLHEAMPRDIPPPTMHGEQVKILQKGRDNNTMHQSVGNTNINVGNGYEVTDLDREILDLLVRYGSLEFKRNLLERLQKFKDLTF